MIYLLIVSLIWAFSFGLIKNNLNELDSNFVSFIRVTISFIVFLPFLRLKQIKNSINIKLILIGAIQFGIMYITYIFSFQYLKAYEAALFTIFTPLYISIINDIFEKKFTYKNSLIAFLSIIGAGIISYSDITSDHLLIGFLLIQISNISFAFGQIYYKKTLTEYNDLQDKNIFALLYFGAMLITFIASLFTTNYSELTLSTLQILTLFYLGGIASGLCFFLWNIGVRKTKTGSLAVFNNMKIPIAVFISLFVFGERTDYFHLTIGGLIILSALLLNEKDSITKLLKKIR